MTPKVPEDVRLRMEQIRLEHPDGNYPAPSHDPGDSCTECEALYALMSEEDTVPEQPIEPRPPSDDYRSRAEYLLREINRMRRVLQRTVQWDAFCEAYSATDREPDAFADIRWAAFTDEELGILDDAFVSMYESDSHHVGDIYTAKPRSLHGEIVDEQARRRS